MKNHSNQQRTGTVRQWNDDKGFGFIDSEDGESVFFHISEYRPPHRPNIGEKVIFQMGLGKNNKQKAVQVQELSFVNKKQREKQPCVQKKKSYQAKQEAFESGQNKNLIIGIIFYIALSLFAWKELIHWFVLGWYLLLGIVTFAIYAKDKHSAKNGNWRTPEKTLHLLALLGGWVGAMLAQTYLRHKSQKSGFRMLYYMTILLNITVLAYFIFGVKKISNLNLSWVLS